MSLTVAVTFSDGTKKTIMMSETDIGSFSKQAAAMVGSKGLDFFVKEGGAQFTVDSLSAFLTRAYQTIRSDPDKIEDEYPGVSVDRDAKLVTVFAAETTRKTSYTPPSSINRSTPGTGQSDRVMKRHKKTLDSTASYRKLQIICYYWPRQKVRE
jgi:hypothetical protein